MEHESEALKCNLLLTYQVEWSLISFLIHYKKMCWNLGPTHSFEYEFSYCMREP